METLMPIVRLLVDVENYTMMTITKHAKVLYMDVTSSLHKIIICKKWSRVDFLELKNLALS